MAKYISYYTNNIHGLSSFFFKGKDIQFVLGKVKKKNVFVGHKALLNFKREKKTKYQK